MKASIMQFSLLELLLGAITPLIVDGMQQLTVATL
jgi:hypothetical protein